MAKEIVYIKAAAAPRLAAPCSPIWIGFRSSCGFLYGPALHKFTRRHFPPPRSPWSPLGPLLAPFRPPPHTPPLVGFCWKHLTFQLGRSRRTRRNANWSLPLAGELECCTRQNSRPTNCYKKWTKNNYMFLRKICFFFEIFFYNANTLRKRSQYYFIIETKFKKI